MIISEKIGFQSVHLWFQHISLLDMQQFRSTKLISILLSALKNLRFLCKPSDMMRVPTRELHACPGYTNTHILTGLVGTHL